MNHYICDVVIVNAPLFFNSVMLKILKIYECENIIIKYCKDGVKFRIKIFSYHRIRENEFLEMKNKIEKLVFVLSMEN